MSVGSHRTDSILRLRAGLLLALFAAALLIGVLGHPFDGDLHVCHADHDHLESHPDSEHDKAACASCHLFQTLSQSSAPPSGGAFSVQVPAVAEALAVVDSLPSHEALFSFASRAPPLA